MNRRLALVNLALVLLFLMSSWTRADGQNWYATFEYDGGGYAVSEEYAAGTWQEGMDYCAAMGSGWRVPSLDEAKAMRVEYVGGDPFDTDPACIESGGGELWTATECDIGAYQIQRLNTVIYCDVPGYCRCYNDPGERYCCIHKTRFRSVHFCPVARCIRSLGGGPSPTPFPATPTASATPEPTMMPQPTATVEATDTAQPTVTPEPTDTAAPVPTMTPQPTETPVPKRTDTPRPTATIETTNTPEWNVTETSSLTPTLTATVMPAVFPFRVWLPVVLRDNDMPCWCWLVGVI